ncbi:hypothetical protein [Variovorax sp. DXTD-1]|uniref:hypothetical protein n=1 Tax=Variovorax sp. DXTD-1 TaxID=2495592 RepID=UPI000F889352|nr:hypothetical protein [Variovorax sp. DXTD-1]RST54059.1 hypothetical protein EJI00_02740 [Variovorax sp. DXTD-1]
MTTIDQSLSTHTYAALQRLAALSSKLCEAVQGAESGAHDLDAQPFVVANGEIRVPGASINLVTRQRPIFWRPSSPVPSALEWVFYAPEEHEPTRLKRIGHLYVTPFGEGQIEIRMGDSPDESRQLTVPVHQDFLQDLRAWVICRLHEIGHFVPGKA